MAAEWFRTVGRGPTAVGVAVPPPEAQAIDRTHRIGQTRNVMVYRPIGGDTIEEKVQALRERKAELFKGVMDDGDLFSGRLEAAGVRNLFG